MAEAGAEAATTGRLDAFDLEHEPMPVVGGHSVILDGAGEPVCIIRTTRVDVVPFGEVAEAVLSKSADGRVVRGIWRITEGTVTDVEQDELFVVLEGRATIAIEGGPTLEVAPGDACVLERGARTTWTVHEPLRKVFQVTLPSVEDR